MHNRYFGQWDGKEDTPAGRYYAAITRAKDAAGVPVRGRLAHVRDAERVAADQWRYETSVASQ